MNREELKDILNFNNVDENLAELMVDYELKQIKKKCAVRSIKEENKNINRFFSWYCESRNLNDITLSQINKMKGLVAQEYVDWLSDPIHELAPNGYKNASLRKFVANIGSFMKFLVKYGHIDINPINGNVDYPFEQPIKKYFSQEEGKAVIDVISQVNRGLPLQNKAMAMLMYWEGCRIEEVANFELENYTNFKKEGLIKVLGKGKGSKKERIIVLFKDVEKAIDEYLASDERREDSKYLFTSNYYGNDQVSVSHIRNIVNDARDITGYKAITPHKYRRLLVERLIDLGVDIEMASRVLGHADVSTTKKHYLQMQESKKMKDIRDLV